MEKNKIEKLIIQLQEFNKKYPFNLLDVFNSHAIYCLTDDYSKEIDRYKVVLDTIVDRKLNLTEVAVDVVKQSTQHLIFFDLETTGFNGLEDDLIELYMLKETTDGKFIDEIHLYFNPGVTLPGIIVDLTKITDEMLKDKPTFKEQASIITNFIGKKDVLIGHNAFKFDLPFLNDQFIKHNYTTSKMFENKVKDTMLIARHQDKVGPFTRGYKLIDLANRFSFEIDHTKFHGAKYDVEVTKQLWLKLLENHKKFETPPDHKYKD